METGSLVCPECEYELERGEAGPYDEHTCERADRILDVLGGRRGASIATIARELYLLRSEVSPILDALLDARLVHVARRTRSQCFYALTERKRAR